MELEFQLTQEDYREFRKDFSRKTLKKNWYIFLLFPLIILFVSFRGGSLGLNLIGKNFEFYSFLVGLFSFSVLLLVIRLPFLRSNKPRNPCNLLAPVSQKISSKGIKTQSKTYSSKFKWGHYLGFYETKNLFVFKNENYLFYLTPKRAFKHDAQMEEFRQLCRENIPPAL